MICSLRGIIKESHSCVSNMVTHSQNRFCSSQHDIEMLSLKKGSKQVTYLCRLRTNINIVQVLILLMGGHFFFHKNRFRFYFSKHSFENKHHSHNNRMLRGSYG